MQTKTERKECCRMYKAIADVFGRRIDLSQEQKHELISQCYEAAMLIHQQHQANKPEGLEKLSLGRRIFS